MSLAEALKQADRMIGNGYYRLMREVLTLGSLGLEISSSQDSLQIIVEVPGNRAVISFFPDGKILKQAQKWEGGEWSSEGAREREIEKEELAELLDAGLQGMLQRGKTLHEIAETILKATNVSKVMQVSINHETETQSKRGPGENWKLQSMMAPFDTEYGIEEVDVFVLDFPEGDELTITSVSRRMHELGLKPAGLKVLSAAYTQHEKDLGSKSAIALGSSSADEAGIRFPISCDYNGIMVVASVIVDEETQILEQVRRYLAIRK